MLKIFIDFVSEYTHKEVSTKSFYSLKNILMEKIEVTMQEIWQATKPIIYKNKKKYSRKDKHKTSR